MKRIAFVLVTILILTTMLFLTACGQYEAAADDDAPLRVVATIFPQYDFVRQIAGDRVELTMLLSPGAESHGFQPTPRDIITINIPCPCRPCYRKAFSVRNVIFTG